MAVFYLIKWRPLKQRLAATPVLLFVPIITIPALQLCRKEIQDGLPEM